MQPNRPTLPVLMPSVFSGTLSVVLGIALLGVANWTYIVDSLPFYDYFFGPEGLVTIMQNSEEGSQAVTSSLFNKSLVNNVLTLLAALGVGVIVFTVLELIRKLRTPNVPIPPVEAHRKAAIRVTVGILWLIYIQLTIKVIFPFCLLATQVGVRALWEPKGFLYIAFGLLLFCICFHVHVICLRLIALKLRVFGGTATLLDSERHY